MILVGVFAGSAVFSALYDHLGLVGIGAYLAVFLGLVAGGSLVYYPLVRLLCGSEILGARDWIVVEIEWAFSYAKFKLVPDDVGVLVPDGNRIILFTNTAKYDLTEELIRTRVVSPTPTSKSRAIALEFDEDEPTRVIRPVQPSLNLLVHGDPQRRIDWFLAEIDLWNPSHDHLATPARSRRIPRWRLAAGFAGVLILHLGISAIRHRDSDGGFVEDRSVEAGEVFGNVCNGKAYDASRIRLEGIRKLVVPQDVSIRAGQEGGIDVYAAKSLDFFGHPPDSMGISESRRWMGAAMKVEGDELRLSTYGQWDSNIEGGLQIHLLLVVPPGVQVSRSLASDSSPSCSRGWPEGEPSFQRPTNPIRYGMMACGGGWRPLHQRPDPDRHGTADPAD